VSYAYLTFLSCVSFFVFNVCFFVVGRKDTVTGFIMAGIGHRTVDGQNFLIVKQGNSNDILTNFFSLSYHCFCRGHERSVLIRRFPFCASSYRYRDFSDRGDVQEPHRPTGHRHSPNKSIGTPNLSLDTPYPLVSIRLSMTIKLIHSPLSLATSHLIS